MAETNIRGLRWAYVLIGVADGTLLPFLPLYMLERGMSAALIGAVLAASPGARLRPGVPGAGAAPHSSCLCAARAGLWPLDVARHQARLGGIQRRSGRKTGRSGKGGAAGDGRLPRQLPPAGRLPGGDPELP